MEHKADPFDSIMSRVPPEIIVTFGRYLDGVALVSALQVCKQWHQNLQLLVWTSINCSHWYHRSFPSHTVMLRHIHLARDLSWSCRAYASRPFQRVHSGRQLSLSQLRNVLQRCTNLRSLSVKAWDIVPDDSICAALLQMHHLRRLDINMIHIPITSDQTVKLEVLFLLLSRVEVLELDGAWFQMDWSQYQEPLEDAATPWRMQKMIIPTTAIPLLRYCPELQELELRNQDLDWDEGPILFSIRPLMICSKLKRLCLPNMHREGVMLDLAETLSSLTKIEKLAYYVHSADEISFLCVQSTNIPSEQGILLQSTPENDTSSSLRRVVFALPLLKDLDIRPASSFSGTIAQRWVFAILKNRHTIQSFSLRETNVDPRYIFSPPGEGCQEWACRDLQSLHLSFSWDLPQLSVDERRQIWKAVYHQVGKLSKLKDLCIYCAALEISEDCGILELAGAKSLYNLQLVDVSRSLRTKAEIMMLLELLPGLLILAMRTGNRGEITRWLNESGRKVIYRDI